ncbi:hypothetical protein ABB37_09658 [Leptomonas pyrrhocoris]|uniref:Uncharacterized protein n=1 Tax=Leptomonas pyrrhocoris TaxID=157538 RepID=A0A0N0DQW2_LEPPY|nr:hypothetical protein ABB37_09656 [Leptomonas pyrrhocoris]XP_015652203.1 hypothetical protein ABB37_09658 [Leptomonas pyrrhocoris]KPA73762.1 hypothetical protein ABB37_09656 [Leptomonas pyrrhocoris]KPA73764.1 hypothetical protein ABB37_09658 [Leptomonas pyrrhocoris]|eukprot:XP_015652201.1 hypothetical protein ABB37_09656 [Leptomonas pyrrhocoris]
MFNYHLAASVEQERVHRTLFIRCVPVGLPRHLVYEILFGEPADLRYASLVQRLRHTATIGSGSGVVPCEPASYPCIPPSRRLLRRVRIHQPRRRAVYCTVFVEFATRDAAVQAEERLEGLSVEEWGGQALQAEPAREAIRGRHWEDFDLPTGRPCLFGLFDAELDELDAFFCSRQPASASFPASPAAAASNVAAERAQP